MTDARDLILAKIANIRAEQEADRAATQAAILAIPQPDPAAPWWVKKVLPSARVRHLRQECLFRNVRRWEDIETLESALAILFPPTSPTDL